MCTLVQALRMSISQYFASGDGLPDVSGLLSGFIPSRVIARTNREVVSVLNASGHVRGAPADPDTTCSGRGWVGNSTWATPLVPAEQRNTYIGAGTALIHAMGTVVYVITAVAQGRKHPAPCRTPSDPPSCRRSVIYAAPRVPGVRPLTITVPKCLSCNAGLRYLTSTVP